MGLLGEEVVFLEMEASIKHLGQILSWDNSDLLNLLFVKLLEGEVKELSWGH